MLYRLDFLNDDGTTEAIRDWLGDFLSRHMTTARKEGTQRAVDSGRKVRVSRIGKAGDIRACLVIRPDGGAEKPEGMSGEDCKAGPGRPPCFCRNCRAGRR